MKRHEFDPLSLVFGLVFLATGLFVAVGRFNLASLDNDWVWPTVAIGAGTILLLPAISRLRAERTSSEDEQHLSEATD
jgi:hypothetical protein